MVDIELIYSGDCPNVNAARENLKKALLSLGLKPNWKEWNRQEPGAPLHAKAFGSPTILVDGQDVAKGEPNQADCCRLYVSESNDSPVGAPPCSVIKTAIEEAGKGGTHRFSWKKIMVTVPAVGAVLIPGVSCPACWPAYAGLLSSLGFGFVNYTPYLAPLATILLLLALFSLFYKARTRRGYRPFAAGLVASILMILGRFVLTNSVLFYSGILLLIIASVWNALPVKGVGSCPACKEN